MYSIYADDKLLHDPRFMQEGNAVMGPKFTVEINKAGSLEFTLPPNHVMYNDLKKLKTKVSAFQNGEELFRGRVLYDDKDFYKQKKVYCEGQMAFLLDSRVRPYTFSGDAATLFRQYISNHNAKVEADKRFTVGKVTVSGKISVTNNNYPNTFDEISEQIIDKVGGQLLIRNEGNTRYIDLIAPSVEDGTVNTSTQTIEFGRNLLDLSEHISAENIYTVLIPLGATLEDEEGNSTDEKLSLTSIADRTITDYDRPDGVGIGMVKKGDMLENPTAIALFGRIEKTLEWSEVTDGVELLNLGIEALKDSFKLAVSITVQAVDLSLIDVNVDSIRVGDWVRVISIPHELDEMFQCTKIVYDMANPENTEYHFGVTRQTLTQKQTNNTKTMKSSVSAVVSTAGVVNSSVSKVNQSYANMEQIIAQMPTDYVNTSTFDAYKTEVGEDFSEIQNDYEKLLARVIALEGGMV